jgi:hypothetical protein
MDGNSAMIAEELNILHISGIALILAFFTARTARGLERGFFKAFLTRRLFANDRDPDRMFERQHIQALKKCPNCSEQLPLTALICEPCDYNFLSGMVGHGHKLLPSPEPRAPEMPTQIFAYRG